MRVELMTSFLPRTRSATELWGHVFFWCTGQDSNLRSRKAAVLQTAGFNHSPTRANYDLLTQTPLLIYSLLSLSDDGPI